MSCLLLSLILAQTRPAPGPLDAFRANRAAISARVEYTYTFGRTNVSVVDSDSIWTLGLPFREESDRSVIGLWESDGHADHYVFQSPEDVIRRRRPQAKPGEFIPYTIPFEILHDGEVDAHHDLGLPVSVLVTAKPVGLGASKGPFLWWGYQPFPLYIEEDFPGILPKRSSGIVGGHATDVEVYRIKLDNGGWYQLEIFYDPSIGYLPRMARVIGQSRGGDDGNVKQMQLINARNVRSGGFVPAEWFETFYRIPSFETKYPDYREGMKLTPRSVDVSVGHFKANKIEDLKGQVKLDHLDNVKYLAAPGGVIVPLSPAPATLSIDEIRARLGRKLTNPDPKPKAMVMPHIDQLELQAMVKEPGWINWGYGATIAALVVFAAGFMSRRFRRRRATSIVLALVNCCVMGCGEKTPPIIKLSAAFTRTSIVYEPGFGRLTIPLVVKNDGTVPVSILKANGGCSCREIDNHKLPATLETGQSMALDVTLHERRYLEAQNIIITFETNHGSLMEPAMLSALPSQDLSPDSHSNVALTEDEDWSFEFVHREIYDPTQGRQEACLEVPNTFDCALMKTESGNLSAGSAYQFEDKTYRVTLKDKAFGLHKAVLILRGKEGPLFVESPVIWQRLPYLATNPSTVLIAVSPVRVFLRCPDESVELRKVRSAPTGIKAVVSSPREVTVMLEANAPGVIQGVIVVETTATGRSPLEIPVVRYAPTPDVRAGASVSGDTDPKSQS